MSGETDATTLQEKEECMQAFRDAAEDVLGRHHRAFLGVFKQMMVGVFGPGMEKMFSQVSPQGYCAEIGESPRAVFFPTVQTKIGLTGFPNWSDRFRPVGCRERSLNKEVFADPWLRLFRCEKGFDVLGVFGVFSGQNRSDRFA
jgi:hypothetical protein